MGLPRPKTQIDDRVGVLQPRHTQIVQWEAGGVLYDSHITLCGLLLVDPRVPSLGGPVRSAKPGSVTGPRGAHGPCDADAQAWA